MPTAGPLSTRSPLPRPARGDRPRTDDHDQLGHHRARGRGDGRCMMPPDGGAASTAEPAAVQARCYRHPNREAGVRCTRCDRPICPECMRPASGRIPLPRRREPGAQDASGSRARRSAPAHAHAVPYVTTVTDRRQRHRLSDHRLAIGGSGFVRPVGGLVRTSCSGTGSWCRPRFTRTTATTGCSPPRSCT